MKPLGEIREGLAVPGAIDVDGQGNLYVADQAKKVVQKYDKYGRLIDTFEGFPVSGAGLAVTADGGTLYVAGKSGVAVVDATSGVLQKTIASGVSQPGEVDIDSRGYLFVANPGEYRIEIYYPNGSFMRSFGSMGRFNGQFYRIDSMSVNPARGQVFVADGSAKNLKVHVFNLNGGLVKVMSTYYPAQWGGYSLNSPRGITFDKYNRMYFLEFMSGRIHVLNSSFGALGYYSNTGYANGKLNYVKDIAYDTLTHRLFVSSLGGKIVVIGLDGATSPVYVNNVPTVPAPQTPAAGVEVATPTPTLVFANATDEDGDAITYTVTVTQDENVVTSFEVPETAGDTTSVAVPVALAENQAYSWTVLATDSEGASSEASAPAEFVVNAIEEAPGVPVLTSPAADSVAAGGTLLAWTETTDPDPNDTTVTYRLEIGADAAFAELVADEAFAVNEVALGDLADYLALEDGRAYSWRVTALDADGTASAPSEAGRFIYDTAILTVSANVPGAKAFLSGNHAYPGFAVGELPLSLRDMAGSFSLVIERPGFEPYVTQLDLADAENAEVHAALVPAFLVDKMGAVDRGINGRDGLSVGSAARPFLVDFDNNGQLDLLVGDASGELQLFPNMVQSGSRQYDFEAGITLGLPPQPDAVPFVVDWDNDGRKDLLVGLFDGTVELFLNGGLDQAPAFAPEGQPLFAGNAPLVVGASAAPAVVDHDGDGLKDLLVGNAAGEIKFCRNVGTDAAPLLAAPVDLFTVAAAAVPFPVDWDADGSEEILVTSDGTVALYQLQDGTYVNILDLVGSEPAGQSDKKRGRAASSDTVACAGVFPIDLDGGKGKELVVGYADGTLGYFEGQGIDYLGSYQAALLAKLAELEELVAAEAPQHLDQVSVLAVLIETSDYKACSKEAEILANELVIGGAAWTSAMELAELTH